jgi:hypothetical protein
MLIQNLSFVLYCCTGRVARIETQMLFMSLSESGVDGVWWGWLGVYLLKLERFWVMALFALFVELIVVVTRDSYARQSRTAAHANLGCAQLNLAVADLVYGRRNSNR